MDMAVPVEHRVKLKQREKLDKYQDLDQELKKLNIQVKLVSIIIGNHGTTPPPQKKQPEFRLDELII